MLECKIINFQTHRLFKDKQITDNLSEQCALINKNRPLSICNDIPTQCEKCKVPKYHPEARIALTKLFLKGYY